MNRHAYKLCQTITRWPLLKVRIFADWARYERGLQLFGRPHHGIDISSVKGSAVAVYKLTGKGWAPVKVSKATVARGYGNSASFCSGPFTVYIAHLHELPKIGDTYVVLGSTGYSTGPHIHCEAFFLDRLINPLHVAIFTYGRTTERLLI